MRCKRLPAKTVVFILLVSQFYPVLAYSDAEEPNNKQSYISSETALALRMLSQLQVQPGMEFDVQELINASTNLTDTDGDGMQSHLALKLPKHWKTRILIGSISRRIFQSSMKIHEHKIHIGTLK